MKICFKCGNKLDVPMPVSRGEICPNCGSYVRCCRNCEFYDPSYHNECRETQSEFVSEKEAASFCDYFRLADREPGTETNKTEEAKRKIDELFKK